MKKLILTLTLFIGLLAFADENSTYYRSKNIEKNDKGVVTSSSESFSYSYSYSGAEKETKEVTSSDENIKEVLDIYKKFYEYKISKNTKALSQILTEDFILTQINAQKQSKSEWFSDIEKEQIKYFSAEEEDVKISLNGNKGTITSRNKVDANIYGDKKIWNLQLIMNVEKINGKWLIKNASANIYNK